MSKIRITKRIKKIVKALSILLVVSVLFLFVIISISQYNIKKFQSNERNILSQINNLSELNASNKIVDSVEINCVKNFDIKKDTLAFKNFGTIQSTGGNCEGYSIFEMLVFENKINEYLKNDIQFSKPLSNLHLSRDQINKLYFGDYAREEYTLLEESAPNYENLVDITIDKKKQEKDSEESKVNFNTEASIGDENLDTVIKAITTIHNQSDSKKESLGLSIYETKPYYSNFFGFLKFNKLDPNYIVDSLKNDKLVVICLQNSVLNGHAALAYGYQKIDDNNIKIYISDSNFPYAPKEITFEEFEKHSFMLFTKEIDTNVWSYIYEPSYNGYKKYGKFNSFIPESSLKIVTIK